MRNYKIETVDEYIAQAPEESHEKLKELRAVVRRAVPEAAESISWGVPFYKYHGLLAGFSVFKKHVSFGFNDQLGEDLKKELNDKGYATGNKTIQIRFDQEVPEDEISKFLKTKAKENESKETGKRK